MSFCPIQWKVVQLESWLLLENLWYLWIEMSKLTEINGIQKPKLHTFHVQLLFYLHKMRALFLCTILSRHPVPTKCINLPKCVELTFWTPCVIQKLLHNVWRNSWKLSRALEMECDYWSTMSWWMRKWCSSQKGKKVFTNATQ